MHNFIIIHGHLLLLTYIIVPCFGMFAKRFFEHTFVNFRDPSKPRLNPPKPSFTVREGPQGPLPLGFLVGRTLLRLRRSLDALPCGDSLTLEYGTLFGAGALSPPPNAVSFGNALTDGLPYCDMYEISYIFRRKWLESRNIFDFSYRFADIVTPEHKCIRFFIHIKQICSH